MNGDLVYHEVDGLAIAILNQLMLEIVELVCV